MEGMELICFQIIASAGGAKTSFMEALDAAKHGDYAQAEELIKQGDDFMNKGHEVHAQLIQKEAAGEKTPVSLLLLHAEDQMMGAEQFKTMALEMIDLYKRLDD
ncbi:MAG: PTS lactose/cellobiose transporter subunit IIA [Allobaculum sp.]